MNVKHRFASRIGLVVLMGVMFGSFAGVSAQAQVSSSAPLYKRVGGYDAIAAVTDDFLARLAGDKQMARFFVGVSADSLRKLRQHVVDQLCEASGGALLLFRQNHEDRPRGLGNYRLGLASHREAPDGDYG
jgi:hypothetical protein